MSIRGPINSGSSAGGTNEAEVQGLIDTSLADHVADVDPHPLYTVESEVQDLIDATVVPATIADAGIVRLGEDVPVVIMKTVDQTESAAVLTDATDLAFTPLANSRYFVEFYGLFQSSAGGNGLRFQFVEPSGTTFIGGSLSVVNGATGATTNAHGNLSGTTVLGTNVAQGSNPTQPAWGWCIIEVGANPTGTFKVQFQSEAAAGASVILQAGSFIRYKRLF